MPQQTLEITEHFQRALKLLEDGGKNIFITGAAGTGKSTLLKHFREISKSRIVVLAPTGVAALNVQGQTIHSFFCFKPDITPDNVRCIRVSKSRKELYQKLKTIIIDEISMVRADIFDAMDVFLRTHGPDTNRPFGGVQMIFFGDMYQLPPVVTAQDRELFRSVYQTPYFFGAKIYPFLDLEVVELNQIFRQKEEAFVNLLSSIRSRRAADKELAELNKRFQPQFIPRDEEFYIYLCTTNRIADEINKEKLNGIDEELFTFEAQLKGDFELKESTAPRTLEVKSGAQVMLLNNDNLGQWVNGTIGQVTSINAEDEIVEVKLEDGSFAEVQPHTWEIFEFYFNEGTNMIQSRSIGSFRQYPLRLAWAITIHKSQGKTFQKVILDIGGGTFAHGQLYVALSRCTTMDGLVLKQKIMRHHMMVDSYVVDFMNKLSAR